MASYLTTWTLVISQGWSQKPSIAVWHKTVLKLPSWYFPWGGGLRIEIKANPDKPTELKLDGAGLSLVEIPNKA